MPPKTGGMRKPAEEKALLAELGKMFHLIKATHKEQRNGREAATAAAAAAPSNAKASTKKAKADTRRGSRRRSRHGGTVWMVLKGGFGPHAVPTAAQTALVDRRAASRALLSEKRRAAALRAAEAYIESAWQQAREAELVNKDDAPTEEGDAYLAEQYAMASKMLCPAAAGAHLHQLVANHCTSTAGAAETAATRGAPTYAMSRGEWEDLCTREAALLFRYRTSATPPETAEDYFRAQQQARERLYHFATAEPVAAGGSGDVVPTKCIVRIRSSQRDKHTAILSTAKAVNYFRSNLGQVLRKELSGSRLPRGGNTAGDDAEPGSGAGKSGAQHGGGAAAAAHHATSAKKKRKR